MDKKILKQMFTDIVGRDPRRPSIMGVHFEEDCCVATDTHILVVYNEGSENFAGKTLTANGEEVKGTYPQWRRVIPAEMPGGSLPISLSQLHKALKWHKQQSDSHKDDKIAFDNVVLSVEYLNRLFNVYAAAGELGVCEFMVGEPARPVKFVSPSLTSILMPVSADVFEIDADRMYESAAVLSYETIINNCAFNSWKKSEKSDELSWIS